MTFTPTSTVGTPAASMDGQIVTGTYGHSNATFTFCARVVAIMGTAMSGPSAWVTVGQVGDSSATVGYVMGVSWSGLAPSFAVYTAPSVAVEAQASITASNSDVFTSGYGGGASGTGIGHLSGGSGAAVPAGPTAAGDTVAQRLERILGYGGITTARAIDLTPLQVQAATDVGGQQSGTAAEAIVASDDGMFAVANGGEIFYKSRPALAADTPVWQLGPDVDAGQYPFTVDQEFATDPNRVVNDVEVSPFSPDGATLPIITPSDASGVNASQKQAGARPLQVTSYLQDQAAMQRQADWLFQQYGAPRRRVAKLTVNAAPHPSAWVFVVAVNIGDLVEVTDVPFGAPVTQGVYRVTELTREVSFGANGASVTGSVEIIADFEPGSYWT